MRRWVIILLLGILSIPIVQDVHASLYSHQISSSGTIDYPGAPTLKFRTDFSDLEIIGSPRPNSFQYVNGTPFPMRQNLNYRDGTARCEIIDDPTAIGGKSFFMEVFEGQPTNARFEINWYLRDLGITDEFYIDVRMRLPDGYHLEAPWDNPTWWGWHEIMNPVDEWTEDNPDVYKMHLQIRQTEQGYVLALTLKTEQTRTVYYEGEVPFVPPAGWFHMKVYVKRHPTDGIVKVWIDGALMFDVPHVRTMDREDFYADVAKLYGGDILPAKQLWVNTVEIYDGLPPS